MGKKSAPDPDPQIGAAALRSAQLGEEYLRFMQGQAGVTNEWATEDRGRSKSVFQPIEDQFIADATSYDSPERKAAAEAEAIADVRQQGAIARASGERRMAAMGVNPASGRWAGEDRRGQTAEALAAAGAGNMAKRRVEEIADAKKANVINLGKGLAVNPATSMGLSNGAASSGNSGAMQGYAQQGNLLNTQFNQQMSAWTANNSIMGGIGTGIGQAVGAMMSSEEAKTDKRKVHGILDAVKQMRIEKWRYKDGKGDGAEHIGTYAEDFKAKTGLGDGKSINVIDALGVTMGALKELAGKVDALGKPKAMAA
jgi:hypothetical protein